MSEEQSESQIRLHLQKGNTAIAVEGPRSYAEQRFEELCQEHLEKESKSSSGSNTSSSNQRNDKELSLTEIFKSSEASTKRDNLLIIGWYLEKFKGEQKFVRSELKEQSDSNKVPLGKNLPRDIKTEIKDSHLKEAGEKEDETAYQLTLSGEEYVKNELDAPEP